MRSDYKYADWTGMNVGTPKCNAPHPTRESVRCERPLEHEARHTCYHEPRFYSWIKGKPDPVNVPCVLCGHVKPLVADLGGFMERVP